MSITDRLGKYITDSGLNINQVTVRCELTPGALNKALRVGRGLHSDTIIALLSNFPDLSPDWLLLGKGPMRRTVDMEQSTQAADPAQRYITVDQFRKEQSAMLKRVERLLEKRDGAKG